MSFAATKCIVAADPTPVPTPAASADAVPPSPSNTVPAEYDAKLVEQLLAESNTDGDVRRGLDVFCSAKFACLTCHTAGKQGGLVGPPLTDIARRAKPAEIVESVLWPRKQVKPEYSAWRFQLSDGRSLQGYIRGETPEKIELLDPTTQKTTTLVKEDIEQRREVGTLMPDGLAGTMTPIQRRDVIRFLLELGRKPGLEDRVRPQTFLGKFTYERNPLVPTDWPSWDVPINRDRIYDYYAKSALHFRDEENRPHLTPQFPGLDSGKYGHWGNQDEKFWSSDDWTKMDLGNLLCGVFRGANNVVVPKGVCIRIGDEGQMSACFNPETLTYDAVWQNGFLKMSDVRHGFMQGPTMLGDALPRPEGKKPDKPFVYHGFYRSGNRIAFAYQLDGVEMLDAPWDYDGEFERTVGPVVEHPWRDIVQGGKSQWPQDFSTKATLGASSPKLPSNHPYVIDTIELPTKNPWNSLIFLAGLDFMPDGSAFVCTMQGDVWHITGLEGDLKDVHWRRYASGLHQALGLKIAKGKVYVLGRDQITCLHDLNGDGEADFYECFSNKMITSPGGHDFICGLERDHDGRFYTASGKQGLIRISADGQKVEVLATGFRNPDGLGLCADGSVTVPCSEGDWTPASMVCLVKPTTSNLEAGTIPPHYGHGGPKNGKLPELPLAYLPRGLDNSSGGQVEVPDGRWGPLAGQLIHFSYGNGSHFLLLKDEVAGQVQGAVVPLVGEFRSGSHRGRFHPTDGQLYVAGMGGWGHYTPDDGCLHRVRYTGEAAQFPVGFHVHENGIVVKFCNNVAPLKLADVRKHFAQAWNYRYSPGYGSPELATTHFGIAGHDVLEVSAVHLIDEKSVFVELPDLQPVNQLHLLLEVDGGKPQELFITAHRLDKPFTAFKGYKPVAKLIAAHPLETDIKLLGRRLENPFAKKRMTTEVLNISAAQNLGYSTPTIKAKAGTTVALTLKNPDVVPHNWVLIKPGQLANIGDLSNKLIADPEAVFRHYVPVSDEVLAYTDMVSPGESFTIYMDVPKEKGRYPFLCTFPGHWMAMNGELVVE